MSLFSVDESTYIIIGKYDIQDMMDDTFWITVEGGEGMQVSAEKLEKLIADFYEKEF